MESGCSATGLRTTTRHVGHQCFVVRGGAPPDSTETTVARRPFRGRRSIGVWHVGQFIGRLTRATGPDLLSVQWFGERRRLGRKRKRAEYRPSARETAGRSPPSHTSFIWS